MKPSKARHQFIPAGSLLIFLDFDARLSAVDTAPGARRSYDHGKGQGGAV
jgi:hypothetical protein